MNTDLSLVYPREAKFGRRYFFAILKFRMKMQFVSLAMMASDSTAVLRSTNITTEMKPSNATTFQCRVYDGLPPVLSSVTAFVNGVENMPYINYIKDKIWDGTFKHGSQSKDIFQYSFNQTIMDMAVEGDIILHKTFFKTKWNESKLVQKMMVTSENEFTIEVGVPLLSLKLLVSVLNLKIPTLNMGGNEICIIQSPLMMPCHPSAKGTIRNVGLSLNVTDVKITVVVNDFKMVGCDYNNPWNYIKCQVANFYNTIDYMSDITLPRLYGAHVEKIRVDFGEIVPDIDISSLELHRDTVSEGGPVDPMMQMMEGMIAPMIDTFKDNLFDQLKEYMLDQLLTMQRDSHDEMTNLIETQFTDHVDGILQQYMNTYFAKTTEIVKDQVMPMGCNALVVPGKYLPLVNEGN